MLELVDFTVSYKPVTDIKSLRDIMAIAPADGMTNFILDIYTSFQNTILPNLK